MSMHLKDLPKLRSTNSHLRRTPAGKENADSNIWKLSRSRSRSKGICESDKNSLCQKISKSVKPCQTPKSDANKIPKSETCPQAPRKPSRRAVLSCKRKLMPEFEFFEANRREEIDEFFRSGFERISAVSVKRKIAAAVADSSSSSSSSSPCNYV